MKTWQKAGIVTLISLAIGGIYLFVVFQQRKNPGVIGENAQQHRENPDDLAVVRAKFPTSFDDVLKLENTSVWMKNGYTMAYFPYDSGHIVFTKPAGVIPTAQRLDIKKVIKASPPASVDDGISHGSRQAFAVFALPGDTRLYATAIGVIDNSQAGGAQEQYYSDVLFYYDDPHTIYGNWPKDVWAAIDAHQVRPGMSELQTRMAIGQKTQSDDSTEGNRTVTYDQAGKQWVVTFVNNHATTIKAP
ncbi:MAG: hypothetical protein ABSD70_19615 [Terracidiphilus sp.]|jgi:hypothetical protein